MDVEWKSSDYRGIDTMVPVAVEWNIGVMIVVAGFLLRGVFLFDIQGW